MFGTLSNDFAPAFIAKGAVPPPPPPPSSGPAQLALGWTDVMPLPPPGPRGSPLGAAPAASGVSPRGAITPPAPRGGDGPSGKGASPPGARGAQPAAAPPAPPPPPLPPQPDLLGFTLSELQPADAEARAAGDAYAARCKSKSIWRGFAMKGKMGGGSAKRKRAFRKGVPHEQRAAVWLACSGADAARRSSRPSETYSSLLGREKSPADLRLDHQIDLDLPRTFPAHPWLATPESRGVLRRVLQAVSRSDPARGYCQSMNYVAAFALLVYRTDEESCYWLVRTALDKLVSPNLYDQQLSGLHIEMAVLGGLIEKTLPRLARKLRGIACPPSLFATEWFLCLFTCTLPAETALRVWDAWLAEGPKVLLRVALALLRRAEAAMLKAPAVTDAMAALKAVCKGAHDRDALMEEAWKGTGSLPGAQLAKLRAVAAANFARTSAEASARREEQKSTPRSSSGFGYGLGY